jgi:hypothetical protein
MTEAPDQGRCNLHGLPVRVENLCAALAPWIDRFCEPFADTGSVGGVIAACGIVKPYDGPEVLRNVTASASAVARVDDLAELFCADERFWLVDERWGMCQINLLKRQWRAWLLPSPSVDLFRQLEGTVLWPLGQLLKMRGLELIPAVSIQKEDWGALILCPWDLEPEIQRLEVDGYRVVARDWSILRARGNGVELLGMPALRAAISARRSSESGLLDRAAQARLGAGVECQAVFVVEPGRRAVTRGRTLSVADAPAAVRRAWPLVELPPDRRRAGSCAGILARQSRCVSVQLSKQEADFVYLVESARRRSSAGKRVYVAISPGVRRASQAVKSIRPVALS